MTKVVSFFSGKCGAGKSASLIFSANALNDMGYSVLVLDMCSNGDVSNNFEFDRESFFGKTTLDWITGDRTIQEVAVKVKDKEI
ncbi:ParA family protein, partial [Bacillus cereus group sp. Bce028]|uniref:ParA family protein n=1 Tax=Bacillus cereus group sp. Bce028 TaxID=3445240 RepID=UPI003F231462